MTTTEDVLVDDGGVGRRPPGGPSLEAALRVPGMRVTGWETEVLVQSRYRPVFRYRVGYEGDGGGAVERIVIGKADYRRGGARTFEYMRQLHEGARQAGEDLGIPEPIAYLDDLSILVQSEAPGRCLYEWLLGPVTDTAPAAAAGRWLGRLHGIELTERDDQAEPAADLAFEARKLGQYRTELAEAVPDHAGRLDDLGRRAFDLLSALPGRSSVPTHGDYQPKNIYVDGSDVTVIDWDRGNLARPERDVGHFVGQCLTMSYSKTGSFEGGTRWNEAFLSGYGETAPQGWEDGLAPYLARTLVEILYYKLVVKPVRDPSFVPVWLDHIEAALPACLPA